MRQPAHHPLYCDPLAVPQRRHRSIALHRRVDYLLHRSLRDQQDVRQADRRYYKG